MYFFLPFIMPAKTVDLSASATLDLYYDKVVLTVSFSCKSNAADFVPFYVWKYSHCDIMCKEVSIARVTLCTKLFSFRPSG